MTLLDGALDALGRGLLAFPCVPRDKMPLGKLCPHGSLDASDDEAVIRAWWKQEPNANIGVRGHEHSIVDVDSGINSLLELENWMLLRDLPRTLTIRTGRRTSFGAQLHYHGKSTSGNYSVNSVSGEVRSGALFGLFPPSIHPASGAAYEFAIDAPIAPVPENLFAEFRMDGSGRRKIGTHTDIVMDGEKARETFFKLLHQAGRAQKGSRHAMAHRVSWFGARAYLAGVFNESKFGDLVLYPGLTEVQIKRMIFNAVGPLYVSDRRNIRKMLADSWASGIAAGRLNLELFESDYDILRLCSFDPRFADVWCGVTTGFDSAVAAKEFLLERLKAVGCADVDAMRIVQAGDLMPKVAQEILFDLQVGEIIRGKT